MPEINVSNFKQLCVDLILQGQAEHVKQIISAFNDVDNHFEEILRVIQLSPHSLEGMLIAFSIKTGREYPLNFTGWPHSVLLKSAGDIQDIEGFILLLNAVEQTVIWEDTFICVKELVNSLPVKAVEDIVNKVSQLGQLRTIVLIYIFEIMCTGRKQYSFSRAALLDLIKKELEQINRKRVYYALTVSWNKPGYTTKDVFPETLYMLMLFELLRVLPCDHFHEDYSYFHTAAFKLLHRETATFSRWNKRENFWWAYRRTLSLIDTDLISNWVSLMIAAKNEWNT